jgi:3-carboxy-cis,cis-muconate cycloisomerase
MTNPLAPSLLLPPLVSSTAMRAIVDDRARLQRMLDFEAALARAEAAVGVVPASVVEPIANACRAELYDLATLAEATTAAGSLSEAVVKALTAEVAKTDSAAASCVHWGASGQDVMDTALVLELRAGIDALTADLNRAIEAFTSLTGRLRRSPFVARAGLRHALPAPFGLKVAGYAAALGRSRERLKRLRKDALVLQFGGAVGTLAVLGDHGLSVTERLSALLDLGAPEAPWHSHRDRLAEVAAALGVLAGSCGKICHDIALLMQNEVAEAFEAPSGAAVSPPRMRPATAAAMAASAAKIAPQLVATILNCTGQEHESGLGGAQAEWAIFPALALVASGGTAGVADLAQGVEVDPDRMRTNFEMSQGLIMAEAISSALAAKTGHEEALRLVEEARAKAARDKLGLQNALSEDERITTHLSVPVLVRLFEPMSHQGAAQTFIDRLVGPLRSTQSKRP